MTIHVPFFRRQKALMVPVRCELQDRLPCVTIVGLPQSQVRETAERVRSAIDNTPGLHFPRKRIVVELVPPEAPPGQPFQDWRANSGVDLGIALAILAASGQIEPRLLERVVAHGELALDGRLRPARGAVGAARAATADDMLAMLVAPDQVGDGALAGLPTKGARDLGEALAWLTAQHRAMEASRALEVDRPVLTPEPRDLESFRDGRGDPLTPGQLAAIRSGAGVIVIGPPGCGKTSLALSIHASRPPMSPVQALDVAEVMSAAGLPFHHGVRPFRAPHHTISTEGMLGNSRRAGELDLALHGTLLLDDFPLFRVGLRKASDSTLFVLAMDEEGIGGRDPVARVPAWLLKRCPVQIRLQSARRNLEPA